MVSTMQLYEKRLQEIIDQHETSASTVVPELYQLLRNAGQKPKEARATLEHDLSRVWKIATVQKHLPEECKDPIAKEVGSKGGAGKHQSKKATNGRVNLPNKLAPGTYVLVLDTSGNQHIEPAKPEAPEETKGSKKSDDYEKSVSQENIELLQRIKELERPFDYPFVIRIGALKIYTSIHVRPANKEVARVDVDEDKLPKEMYAQ